MPGTSSACRYSNAPGFRPDAEQDDRGGRWLGEHAKAVHRSDLVDAHLGDNVIENLTNVKVCKCKGVLRWHEDKLLEDGPRQDAILQELWEIHVCLVP